MTPEVPAKGAIVVRALTLRRRDTVAIDGLDGRFAAGSMTAVHGPNGAGKTTLLEALAGLLAPSAGTVTRGAGSRVAYLPQQSEIDRRFPIDVHAVVALGAWPRTGAWRGIDAIDRAAIDAALDLLGIADLATRAIASLSTGQFQRVLFARVIVQDADIVLLDEPFNAVDQRTTTALMEVLHRLHDEGRTVIAALHDVDQIRDHFDRTLSLARHCVAWGATSSVLRGTPRAAGAWIDDAQPVSS